MMMPIADHRLPYLTNCRIIIIIIIGRWYVQIGDLTEPEFEIDTFRSAIWWCNYDWYAQIGDLNAQIGDLRVKVSLIYSDRLWSLSES